MPLPTPKKREPKDKFIHRCMSVAKDEFPNQKQRLAVCHSQFAKKKEVDEMELKQFSAPFEIKDIDEDKGEFEGHAAIFDKVDGMGDIIVPGAFKKSLHTHPKKKVKMLRQHNMGDIIGVWDVIKEDSDGLFVKGRLLLQLQKAQETFILMKEGVLDSMSIGFRTVVDEFDSKKMIRKLLEVKLFEISVVAIPAQKDALITGVKHVSPTDITTKRELENALRDAEFSESTSKFIAAGWNPPAHRDDEGEDETVKRIRRLTETVKTATGEIRHG